MLEARDLRLVRSIEENRSLVRAARALGTTQPALTRSLAALEARLQGRLFERSRQGVIATDLGRAVLADAADILERLDRLDRRLTEVRGGQRRELTLIAGNYVGETVGHRAAARMLAPPAEISTPSATMSKSIRHRVRADSARQRGPDQGLFKTY
jgi:DNA-binding transcriptional LysR family regulator